MSKGEFYSNSEFNVSSASAADKSLLSSPSISRPFSSISRPAGSKNPPPLTGGLLLKNSSNFNKNVLVEGSPLEFEVNMQNLLSMAAFDWFQGTVCAADGSFQQTAIGESDDCVKKLMSLAFREKMHPCDTTSAGHGYGAILPFQKSAESKIVVMKVAAQHSKGMMPNITIPGAKGACEVIAPKLQKLFPEMLLSRADVKIDVSQEGLFLDLLDAVKRIGSRKKNFKIDTRYTLLEDKDIGVLGRSFIVGSKQSTVWMRIYEKDLERVAKGDILAKDADPNLVRVETVFQPQSSGKKSMAAMQPHEMLLTSLWVREVIQEFAKILDVAKQPKLKPHKIVREYKEKTLSTTIQHGVKQYGKAFADKAIETIVEQKFGGDYAKAKIDYAEARQRAIELFARHLDQSGIIKNRMKNKHVLNALTADQYADQIVADMASFADKKSVKRKAAAAAMAELHKAVAANFLSTGAYSVCKARARQVIKAQKHEAFAFRQKIKKIRDCQKAA